MDDIKKNEEQQKINSYAENLIDKIKIENMHKRFVSRNQIFQNFIDLLNQYQNSCYEFSKPLKSKYLIIENASNSVIKLCNQLLTTIKLQNDIYCKFSNELNNLIKNNKNLSDNNEKKVYNDYTKLEKEYKNDKINSEKEKNQYNKDFAELEQYLKDSEEKNINNIDINIKNNDKTNNNNSNNNANNINNNNIKIDTKISKMVTNVKKNEKLYQDSIENLKKKKVKKNSKEKDILMLYQKYDEDFSNKIKEIIGKFIEFYKNLNESNRKLLEELDKAYKNINISKDIDGFINKVLNSNNKNIDEEIKYESYKPKYSIIPNSENKSENYKDLDINFRVTLFLKNKFKDICPDINLKEEEDKNILRKLSSKIFESKDVISDEDQKKILALLENKKNRDYLLVILSKQRSNSRFQKSVNIIRNMGEILKKILEYAEKENGYDHAKYCIILSQTFYSEEKDKKKKNYLFEFIKNNKWLTSTQFWEKMVDNMINKEIEINNNILGKAALEKETPEIRRVRISQVCLTQLITFSGNMVDFNLDKNDIKKIIDDNVKKYEIDESNANIIYESFEGAWKEYQKIKSNQISPENDDILYAKMKFSKLKSTNFDLIKKRPKINFDKIDKDELNKMYKEKERRHSISGIRNENYILKGVKVIDNIKKEFVVDELKLKSKAKSQNLIENTKKKKLSQSVMLAKTIKTKSEKIEPEDKKEKFKEKNEIKEENEDEEESNNINNNKDNNEEIKDNKIEKNIINEEINNNKDNNEEIKDNKIEKNIINEEIKKNEDKKNIDENKDKEDKKEKEDNKIEDKKEDIKDEIEQK